MRKTLFAAVLVVVLAVTAPALALNPGSDIYVPAAARAGAWVTDLYIFNPGSSAAAVSVYWLARDTDNSSVTPVNFTVNAGQTLILEDVISNTFGLDSAAGAFRITSDADVVANCRIYSADGSQTFGQGFEGVPAAAAVTAGGATDIVGLAQNDSFRSNFFAVNTGSSSASITFTLVDPQGNQLASRSYTLPPYAAFYRNVTDLGGPSFNAGTLHAEVTAGTAIVVGSKVDNASGDPTTLEAWWALGSGGGGGGSCGGDGVYVGYMQYTYIGGLLVVVENNAITYLQGANVFFSPDDGGMNCANVYGWGYEPDTPFAIAGDGTFTANFQVQYSSATVTFTFTGAMQEDTLLGSLDVHVDTTDPSSCRGDLNTVPFYAGHTILTLSK